MIKSFFAALSLFAVVLVGMPAAQAAGYCFHTLNRDRIAPDKFWDDVNFQVVLTPQSAPLPPNGLTSYSVTGLAVNSVGDTGAVFGTAYTDANNPLAPVRFNINTTLKATSQPLLRGVPLGRPLLLSLDTIPLVGLQNPVPGVAGGSGTITLIVITAGYVLVDVVPTSCSAFGTGFLF